MYLVFFNVTANDWLQSNEKTESLESLSLYVFLYFTNNAVFNVGGLFQLVNFSFNCSSWFSHFVFKDVPVQVVLGCFYHATLWSQWTFVVWSLVVLTCSYLTLLSVRPIHQVLPCRNVVSCNHSEWLKWYRYLLTCKHTHTSMPCSPNLLKQLKHTPRAAHMHQSSRTLKPL